MDPKKFISEKEVEEVRQKRQEEWEKARKSRPNVPNPDEVDAAMASSKTLYEQLQLQKVKKDEELAEAKKYKNMIRGLDDEESAYLNVISKKQMEADRVREMEQQELIKELRKQSQTVQLPEQPSGAKTDATSSSSNQAKRTSPQNSLLNLVKQAVKRKPDEKQAKKCEEPAQKHPVLKQIGVLPSLVSNYGDSDEESKSTDSNSSDSSEECDVSCTQKSSGSSGDIEIASFKPSIAPALVRRIRRELQGGGDE